VRIAVGSEVVGYCSGDKVTVVRVIGPSTVVSEHFLYVVSMDKDGPDSMATFTPDKLESDV
jgi:hypothetical protein